MSYFSEQDIDTRTCGQADEDAWLDRRDGLTAHSYTRSGVLAGLEAQRAQAAYAARPALTDAQRAQDLANKMIAAIKADRKEEAREYAIQLRPLMGLLP